MLNPIEQMPLVEEDIRAIFPALETLTLGEHVKYYDWLAAWS